MLHSFAGLYQVHSRVSYRERVTNFGPHRAASWTVCSLAFRRELTELGLPAGRKSDTVAPPTQPFSGRDYLRGLIDGDGSVGFTRTGKPFLSFTTASQPLADYFIAQVMDVTGVYRSVNRNARDGVYNPMLTGEPAATMAEWLYADACLALDRERASATLVAAWTRPEGELDRWPGYGDGPRKRTRTCSTGRLRRRPSGWGAPRSLWSCAGSG